MDISWLPEWITTIVAFIVAVASLWYSSLKGPDIDLCENPKFVMEKIPWVTLNYIPDRIRFSPAQLIFINNGTRSGVVRLRIDFQPSEEFKPFFSSVYYIFKVGEKSSSGDMPPISIRERESCIIEVEIRVELHDWKEYFDYKPVSREEISDILCQADNRNCERFSNFCSTLRPGVDVGRISIVIEQTMRKNVFSTTMGRGEKLDLPIGSIDQQFIDGFRSCLDKWNDIEPNCILMKAGKIKEDLSDILKALDDNLDRFGKTPPIALRTDFWRDWKRRFEGYEYTKALVDFIFKSSGLESKIVKFCSRADGFNHDLEFFKAFPSMGWKEKTGREWNLNKQVESLKREIEGLRGEIRSLQEILSKCVP